MKQPSIYHFGQSAYYALLCSTTIVALVFATFFLAEPSISHGQSDSADFTIKQTISDETSFTVIPTDVTTTGSIQGVTGGNASGTTNFTVTSNNSTGYYVQIAFSGSEAMIGDTSGSNAIKDYLHDATGEPSYGYTTDTAAQFAYTVSSDTTGDTDGSFLNNSSACNAGGTGNGTTKATKCWKAPDTTPFRIVDRGTAAPAGAASTIEFDITVPSGAVPAPTADTYTATATLTLYTQ